MTVTVTVEVEGQSQVRVGVTGEVGGEVVTLVQGDGKRTATAEFGLAPGAVILIGPEAVFVAPVAEAEPAKSKETRK